jgi:excisionase family DNA binding protein
MPAKRRPDPDPQPVDADRRTKAGACDYLLVGRSKLQHLMATGEIRYLKVGGRVQFEIRELDRYLATCRAGVGQ